MTTTNDTVSRRSFLAAGGVLAAGAALPMFPALPPQAGPSGRWTDAASVHGAALRSAYMAEIARLAESLRPRFEAGELRANRDVDYEVRQILTVEDLANMPMGRCEAIVAEHFGTHCTRTGYAYEGDEAAAYVVLAFSPSAASTEDNYNHPCYHAQTAAAWDLITTARERGWYTPTADEEGLS